MPENNEAAEEPLQEAAIIPETPAAEETPPPGPVVVEEELQQPITNPETNDMEIHHKHHHDAPGHKEKLWKHYLFEFLMLFLAITAGFFVENQREHYIEYKRAEVYAASMVTDLQRDTAEFNQIIVRTRIALNNLDSFLSMVSSTAIENIPTGKLYWYGLWGGYFRGFQSSDATFQQMKGSGSLRYFTNNALEKNISDYDQHLRSMYLLNQVDQPLYLEIRKARARIFDFRFNDAANKIITRWGYAAIKQEDIDAFIATNPPLLSNDKILMNEYIELCRSRNLRQELRNYQEAQQLAVQVIAQLKDAY